MSKTNKPRRCVVCGRLVPGKVGKYKIAYCSEKCGLEYLRRREKPIKKEEE